MEFKAYAEEKLPHAKVIAIESDREFGLSVLESLQAEITQRAELLRATGGRQAGMQALRETTGSKIRASFWCSMSSRYSSPVTTKSGSRRPSA